MKVGFTSREAYSMFRSLRSEVFRKYNYEGTISFGTRVFRPEEENAIAYTSFSDTPDSMLDGMLRDDERATGVRMSLAYLPHIAEDELEAVLLHELAHVLAGFRAAHYEPWRELVVALGAPSTEWFVIRNWEQLPGRISSMVRYTVEIRGVSIP